MVLLAAVGAKLFEIIIADHTSIDLGHTPQSFDCAIDIVACDQPLGTLLYEEIEQRDEQQRQRGAGQKRFPVANQNRQPRSAYETQRVEQTQYRVQSDIAQ